TPSTRRSRPRGTATCGQASSRPSTAPGAWKSSTRSATGFASTRSSRPREGDGDVTDPPPPSLSRQATVADLLATAAHRPNPTPTVASAPAGAADRDLWPLLRRRLLIFCILGT